MRDTLLKLGTQVQRVQEVRPIEDTTPKLLAGRLAVSPVSREDRVTAVEVCCHPVLHPFQGRKWSYHGPVLEQYCGSPLRTVFPTCRVVA